MPFPHSQGQLVKLNSAQRYSKQVQIHWFCCAHSASCLAMKNGKPRQFLEAGLSQVPFFSWKNCSVQQHQQTHIHLLIVWCIRIKMDYLISIFHYISMASYSILVVLPHWAPFWDSRALEWWPDVLESAAAHWQIPLERTCHCPSIFILSLERWTSLSGVVNISVTDTSPFVRLSFQCFLVALGWLLISRRSKKTIRPIGSACIQWLSVSWPTHGNWTHLDAIGLIVWLENYWKHQRKLQSSTENIRLVLNICMVIFMVTLITHLPYLRIFHFLAHMPP